MSGARPGAGPDEAAEGRCGTWFPPPPFIDSFVLPRVVLRRTGAGEGDRAGVLAALVAALPATGPVQVWTELPHDPAGASEDRLVAEFTRLRDGIGPQHHQSVQTRPDPDGRSTTVVVEHDPSPRLLARLADSPAVAAGTLRTCLTDERCTVFLRPVATGVEVLGADAALVDRVAAAAPPPSVDALG
ncbi:hypothetical protein [Kineococcus sp. NPDC059986]|jgi:hypothetical protein|uniref:hypothetical protein n=1 Tax=Kineococcus sp. NPDC059986 TaxID=3155538 RepID=UPI0034508DF7